MAGRVQKGRFLGLTQPVAARVVVVGLVTASSALRVDGPHGPKVLKVLKFDGPTGRGLWYRYFAAISFICRWRGGGGRLLIRIRRLL